VRLDSERRKLGAYELAHFLLQLARGSRQFERRKIYLVKHGEG
jgi:hypothetical protein